MGEALQAISKEMVGEHSGYTQWLMECSLKEVNLDILVEYSGGRCSNLKAVNFRVSVFGHGGWMQWSMKYKSQ